MINYKKLGQSRLNRQNFVKQQAKLNIIFLLIVIPTIFILWVMALGLGMSNRSSFNLSDQILFIFLAIIIVVALTGFAYKKTLLNIRRLHDCNQSGWLSAFVFIPVINLFFILYLYCCTGNNIDNRYGAPQNCDLSVYSLIFSIMINIGFGGFIIIYLFTPLLAKIF